MISASRPTPAPFAGSEFFRDDEGVIYKRRSRSKHQIVVPRALIHTVFREKHDPVFVAHLGIKSTYDFVMAKKEGSGHLQQQPRIVVLCHDVFYSRIDCTLSHIANRSPLSVGYSLSTDHAERDVRKSVESQIPW